MAYLFATPFPGLVGRVQRAILQVQIVIDKRTLLLSGTNEPVPGLLICADADPENAHYFSYYYTILLITECILLSLALYQAFLNWRYGTGGGVITLLTRDSVKYFIV